MLGCFSKPLTALGSLQDVKSVYLSIYESKGRVLLGNVIAVSELSYYQIMFLS